METVTVVKDVAAKAKVVDVVKVEEDKVTRKVVARVEVI